MKIKLLAPHFRKPLSVNIFEMQATQSADVALQHSRRITAPVKAVTSVEAQAQFFSREHREQLVDFFRGLHVCAYMVMERYPQA
jgi:hypothetical protein